jgi:hypothetical protein
MVPPHDEADLPAHDHHYQLAIALAGAVTS